MSGGHGRGSGERGFWVGMGPEVGTVFPEFALPDADGRVVRLSEWRAGRRAVVVFYRSAVW